MFQFHLVLLLISDSFWKFIFLKKWSSSLDFFFLSNIGIKLYIVFLYVCVSFVPQCTLFIMYLFSVLLADYFTGLFKELAFHFFEMQLINTYKFD